jgi:hypothetical protein
MAEARTLQITVAMKDELSRPLTATERALTKFGRFAKAAFSGITSQVFSLRTAIVGLFGGFAIKSIADRADAMQKLADSTGDTTQNISELAAVFALNNVSGEKFTAMLRALVKAQAAAIDGNAETLAGFQALGITLDQLRTLGPSQLFELMAKGLEKFESAQAKVLVTSKILPKQFIDALPVIGKGLSEFQKSVQEVQSLHATVLPKQAAAADALGDAFDKVKIAVESVGRELIASFGPSATVLLEKLAHTIADNEKAIVQFAEAVGRGIVSAVNVALDAIIGLVDAIDSIPGVDLIDTKKAHEQLRDLQEELLAITSGGMTSKGEQFPNMMTEAGKQRVEAIKAEMTALNAALSGGLAVILRQQRDQIAKSISDASSAVGGAGGDQQLPPGWDLSAMIQGLEKVEATATSAAAAASTVFQQPTEDAKALAAATQAAGDELDDLTKKNKQPPPLGFVGGLTKGFEKLKLAAMDFAGTAGMAIADVATSGLDAFADGMADVITGAKSAKDAFKDFARAFLLDIAKMISRLIVLGTIKTLFGLEDGGVMPGGVDETLPMRGFAKGGIARRPTLAVFGEGRSAEAFVPLPDGRTIPVTLAGGGGGANVTVNITAMDSKDVARALHENQGMLRSLWQHQAEHTTSVRHVIKRAAS